MSDKDQDAALRQMALHRGFKLVKSRRRKPGGDYGLYGLTDAEGAHIIGFGGDGLTAGAREIEAYLRKGERVTWQTSVSATPARAVSNAKPAQAAEPEQAHEPPRRAAAPKPVPPPLPPEPPRPTLAIRKAGANDIEALAPLMAADVDPQSLGTRLSEIAKAMGGVLVADRDGLLGVIAWVPVPTLQHGPVGRITLILVAERERRAGIGRMLFDAAAAELAKRGCATIEAMSDIEMRNAHGFFRALGFEQTSYRFALRSDE
ncbi:MAG: acetyltransferase family protein [Rhizorhabdus sp.]|nr:acetyltransferase family protein [Rhizorhabdus sp.]